MNNIHPLVTLVTPSFNQARFLRETLECVIAQDYQPIEHIVIDGGSTDGTLDILHEYDHHITWVSEPDNGQADAINKGFRRANGAILAWLNADDLLTPGAVRLVAEYFTAHPEVYFVYGNAEAIDERGRTYGLRVNVGPGTRDDLIHTGDFIVQPAAFWRAELWRNVGELDGRWHYVLDYEYWIRAAQHYNLVYLPYCLAKERIYDAAKTFSGGIGRIKELETMPGLYGGQGIPRRFRPEAAATLSAYALRSALHGDWTKARAAFKDALRVNASSGSVWLYLLSFMVFGQSGLARPRLIANRIRNIFFQRPRNILLPVVKR